MRQKLEQKGLPGYHYLELAWKVCNFLDSSHILVSFKFLELGDTFPDSFITTVHESGKTNRFTTFSGAARLALQTLA